MANQRVGDRKPTTDITLIIPFFGKIPPWISLFLHSCYANPGVSFLLFSDRLATGRYGNINVVRMQLSELKTLAEEKLAMPVCLDRGYKICDLRPAFGIIFDDYLSDTRFWGTCDLDVLFGDIRKFISDELLDAYDVISAKREYLIGHFTLYRNCDNVNNLFRESADYRQVFTSPQAFAFDECNFLWWQLLAGKAILDNKSTVDSMSHVVKRMEAAGLLRAYFNTHVIEQDKLGPNGYLEEFSNTLRWDNGRLADSVTGREYLSFHFHFMKKQPTFAIPDWNEIPARFWVSKAGFTINRPSENKGLSTQ